MYKNFNKNGRCGRLFKAAIGDKKRRGRAGIWTRMQAAYDTWHAEREVNVTDIPTIGRLN